MADATNDPIERLKEAAKRTKAAKEGADNPSSATSRPGFASRVSRVVTNRKAGKSHNIHGPLDPDPIDSDNEVGSVNDHFIADPDPVSYGDEVSVTNDHNIPSPDSIDGWIPNTEDFNPTDTLVDGQDRFYNSRAGEVADDGKDAGASGATPIDEPVIYKWSDVAADIVSDHYTDGVSDEAANTDDNNEFLSEVSTPIDLADTPVRVQSTVARPSGRSHDLETLQVVGATVVGPTGQQISATVNSLGQPRSMSPEEAHQKLTQLRIYTRSYWDAQKHRIKIGNRAFSGVTDVETIKDIRDSAKRTEELLSKALIKNFKAAFPEIYAWTEETPGLGPVLMGRLLGEIGHPCWAFPSHWEGKGETRKLISDPPFMRNPAKLFAYCGVGDPKRRPFKGMTDKDVYAMGNPKAKMLVHLLAESCMKQQGSGNRRRSPYRDTYDVFRARYEDRMETKVNKKTGKEETKPWTDGHKHNAALRVTGKEILLDLWVLAERAL